MQMTSTGSGRPQKGKMGNILREFLFSIFVRKTLVITIFVVVFILIVLIALLLPPVYRSTAKFSMVMPRTIDPLEIQTAFDYKNQFQRELQNQVELITSNRVLVKAMEKLGWGNTSNPDKWAGKLRKKLNVTPPKGETFEGTSYFLLNYEASTPHRSHRFANAIAEEYLVTFGELAQEKADTSYSFFREQTTELYEKMLEKERILRDYEKEQAVLLIEMLNLESGAAANMETGPNMLLTRFLGKYHELQEELAGIQVAIDTIEKQSGRKIPVVLPEMEVSGRAITVFKRKVAQLQIQLNEMKPRFRQRFELLKQVEKELNLNISSLRNELERSVLAKKIQARSIEARLVELQNTIDGLKERIRVTAQEKSIYEQLKQHYELARGSYVSASNQLEQARLSQALNKEKQMITMVDPPVVPDSAAKPNRVLIIILGLFAALFLALATALMLDFFDHSIRKNEDIEDNLEITILGSIPKMS